jgi:hypothetical protein
MSQIRGKDKHFFETTKKNGSFFNFITLAASGAGGLSAVLTGSEGVSPDK